MKLRPWAFFAVAAVAVTGSAGGMSGRLGLGMECLDRDLWNPEPAYDCLTELAVTRVRLQSGWARTEKVRGVYDFAWLDRIMGELKKRNVEPWICLCYGNPIYAAAEDGEQKYTGQTMNPLHSADGRESWLNYVREIVRRYRDQVRVWEVWNEPDISHFFRVAPDRTWTEEYVELLKITAEAIRGVQPSARVAVQTAGGPDGRMRAVASLFEQGAGRFADIYSFHAYVPQPEMFTRDRQDAFYPLVRRLAPQIEFWRGEAGIASEYSGSGALSVRGLSESVQARWMSRHLVRDLADPQIGFTSYFHLYDFEHYSHTVRYHYGLLRHDYSRKPSFGVFKRLKRLLDDGEAEIDRSIGFKFDLWPWDKPAPGDEAYLNTAVAYAFRRKGLPLVAFTATTPFLEEHASVRFLGLAFFGSSAERWKDPVLVDLVDGSAVRVEQRESWPEPKLVLPLKPHVQIVTEAAALLPYYDLGAAGTNAVRAVHQTQSDHE